MNPFKLLFALVLALSSAPATAGLRATYAVERAAPRIVQISDTGDINAELSSYRRLIVRGGEAFVVEDRWTGPLVMRVADLQSLLPPAAAAASSPSGLLEQGDAAVSGRSGRAYYIRYGGPGSAPSLFAVISPDPALSALAAAMRRVFAVEDLLTNIDGLFPQEVVAESRSLSQILDQGAPLKYGEWSLRTLEEVPLDAQAFALPGEPESQEAMRARRAEETAENQHPTDEQMISRAVFAADRLWLLTDAGSLSSLAEGERSRTRHPFDEPVLDMCRQGNTPVALTGLRNDGRSWTLRQWSNGEWRPLRTVMRRDDSVVALSCDGDGASLLTTKRLIRPGGEALDLHGELGQMSLSTAMLARPEAFFAGLNAGEWGGGLRRIDARTGQVTIVEKNATGDLCDGPLNTSCDPVNGLATIPWRPDCVAAAIGLIHFMAHGRIAAVCPSGIEQLFVATDGIDPEDRRAVEQAAAGGYGAVAFFGLTATTDALLAVGHNGIYRIDATGRGSHEPWPRFAEIDGILVSFARPDVILVLTQLNGRASISGSTPILVLR